MKTQNDMLHELSQDRISFEEYEAFQYQEALQFRNNIRFAIMLGINIMLFAISCCLWYLVSVGTLPWYHGVTINLVLGIIMMLQTSHYLANHE